MRVVYLLMGLMGTVTFTQFILEEALQQASFSCYHYRSAYKERPNAEAVVRMESALIKFEQMIVTAEDINKWIGWVNPLTRPAFAQYNSAARMQYDAYMLWLQTHQPPERRMVDTAQEDFDDTCMRCGGTGQYRSYGNCYGCDGTGKVQVHETSY